MEQLKLGLMERLYSKREIKKINRQINLLGINKKITVKYFLNFRFWTTLFLFVSVFLLSNYGFIYAPFLSFIYYFFCSYFFLKKPLEERKVKLEHEAFYYFEVLTITLESGRNLENSILIACNYISSEISEEFKETLKQISLGKSLSEALENMQKRIPSEVINNIILNIIQSNLFGSNILETMYNQLDFLREKQILAIKEEISKIPLKVSVLSVLFFIPLIMALILTPLLIEFF